MSSEERIRSLEFRVQELESQNEQLRSHLAAMLAEEDTADARVEELQRELEAIRHSTFWRMTAPLRQLVGLFRSGS